jgi:predicted nucleic acid-binding protein
LIVLDSSAATDYLARLDPGEWVAEQLLRDPDLHAPHLLDVEVVNALRGLVLQRRLSLRAARAAVDDLADLDLVRYPHLALLDRIWTLRGPLTAYDATFVALAEELGATLVTTDRRQANAAQRYVTTAAYES